MRLGLNEIARAAGLQPPDTNPVITGWSVDTRIIEHGDLFFALRGPSFDGNAFIGDAFREGAVAAVGQQVSPGRPEVLTVPDTQKALEQIASHARSCWNGTVIGVTGSAGKTTTKELIAQFLSVALPVGKTSGNLNNHVGMPLSLLRLPEEAKAAVIEIGMNHPGEIRRLAAIARPSIAVVTMVGLAHAEFFNSADEVALAKRELIEALPPEGVAVLNADDPRVSRFREVHPGPAITFGLSEGADVRPEQVEYTDGGLRFRLEGTDFQSRLSGRHNVLNLLAAFAVARLFGIPFARLQAAVATAAPGRMRGERFTWNGITVLNDCYNSNPEAARSMLDVLKDIPARRRIGVLGEMLELGHWSESLHRDVGRHAAACEIDVLVGIRGAARLLVDEAVRSGFPVGAAAFFEDPASAGEFVRATAAEGDVVLFKGSRGTRVELALERFLNGNPAGSELN